MKQILIGVIVIFVLVAGGMWLLDVRQTFPITSVTNPTGTPSADLMPLYDRSQWNGVTSESFTLGTTTYTGVSVSSIPVTGTMNPGDVFTPFEKYYDQKLKALGWEEANDLAAGGHVGGQTGYRKDGDIILTRFRIDYHTVPADAPSECPCDVTLSLFSTGK